MNVRAIMIEGNADPATMAAIRAALEAAPGPVSIIARAAPPTPPCFDDLVRKVSFETGVAISVILGAERGKQAIRARNAVVWIARERMAKTYGDIGDRLGYRDHKTIISAYHRARQMRNDDPSFLWFTDRLMLWFEGQQ